ncbi:Argonaute-3, partial [Ephemera danica]
MTGLTDNMRKDHKAMKEVATYTQLNPNQRHYAIKSYLYGIDCPKARELLAAWGLSMDQDTVELHGRILTGEELHFGNGAKIKVSNQGEWMKAVVAHKMLQVVS